MVNESSLSINGRVFMDVKQIWTHNQTQNEKLPSKISNNKDKNQQDVVLNLMTSVKENENLGNSFDKKLHEQKKESPKKSLFNDPISPIPNSTLLPLKPSLKVSTPSQKNFQKEPLTLAEIFKKEDSVVGSKKGSFIRNGEKEIVFRQSDFLNEPQSGFSSHMSSVSPAQKTSFKSNRR